MLTRLSGAFKLANFLIVALASVFVPTVSAQQVLAVPVPIPGRLITVDVRVDDRIHPFILDTGSTRTFVDVELVNHLGQPLMATNAFGNKGDRIYAYSSAALSVNDRRFKADVPVVAMDMRPISAALYYFEKRPMGILGVDFLKDYVLRIDNSRSLCTLSIPNDNVAIDRDRSQPLELLGDPPVPFLKGRIGNGEPSRFLLDTGANVAVSVLPADYDNYVRSGQITDVGQSNALGVRGARAALVGRVSQFSLDDFTHSRLGIVNAGAILGMAYLQRFDMTIDFPGKRIELARSKWYDRPDHTDWDGLRISKATVVTVVPGTQAERAGFRTDDRIVAINGIDVTSVGDNIIMDTIAMRGRDVTITVARGDTKVSLTLKFKD